MLFSNRHDELPRVLHLVEHLYLGGIEKLLEQMARAADAAAHSLIFYTYMSAELRGIGRSLQEAGYRVYHEQKRDGYDFALLLRLRDLVRREAISVVHTHDMGPMEYAIALRWLCPGLRLIHTQHTLIGLVEIPKYLAFFQFASWFYHRLHPVSEHVLSELRTHAPRAAYRRFQVIPNGVRVSDCLPVPPHERGGTEPASHSQLLRILGVARISPEKNIEQVLRALAVAKQRGLCFQYLHAGRGTPKDEATLHQLVVELGLAGEVSWLGFCSDEELAAQRATSDIFISASRTEGHPVAVLEALAAAQLCLLSDIQPHQFTREIAHFFALDSSVALCDLLIAQSAALGSRENEQRRKRGRELVSKRFSLAQMMGAYQESYQPSRG